MKILYIANEGHDAQVAAAALRGIAPDVTVVWPFHFDEAADWIREHRDVAALVVDAQVNGQSCTSFLKHVRSLGLTAPVVIIAPEEAAPRLESLKAKAYDFVLRNPSLIHNLPGVVSRAIEKASEAEAAAERHAQRQAEFDARLADAVASRSALERRLSELEASLHHRERTWAIERAAAAERRTALEALVHEERAKSADLKQKLAQTATMFEDAERRHLSAMTSAAEQLADRQARHELSTARAAATREMVEEQFREAAIEVARARQSHSSAAAKADRLAQREAELASQLADAAATREGLELRLAEAATAIADADERVRCERLEATARQEAIEERLTQELKKAETLERELADARSAAADAEQRFREDADAISARAHEQAACLEDQIARDRLAHESRLAEMQEQFQKLALERDAQAHDLEEARRSFQQTLERVSSEHAGALAALAASVTDRDEQIEEQAARHSASLQAAASERTQLQDSFRTALAERMLEVEQLDAKLKATTQELDASRSRQKVLQAEADLVPQLQSQLDERGAESRRQFEHSPMALCRCTQSGALIRANQAFAALAGYRRPDQLRSADFAATIFESPDDLSWLIERCLSTRARESIETVWKGRKGNRLVVRLSAFASASDVIELGAEDLTNVRVLQDRLEQAHRMEAVGWLASEVAVTCGHLLRDIQQNAQQWLTMVGGNTALRRQGEMLLDEVARAASFLRQLAAYSDDEIRGLVPVDLNRVLRDLEPVLKRVAGDAVELELPKTSSPLDVDVKAERVERLLVNLASYGRERMPLGGRLSFDLDTVIVDRRFIAKYPNVRQGPHALITVTEARRTAPAEEPLLRNEPASDKSATEKPGVDLGALQELISECNGHLWMSVGPPGEMVVKIHLPLAASDSQAHPRTSLIRSRGSLISRWFRH